MLRQVKNQQLIALGIILGLATWAVGQERSEKHNEYAKSLWNFVQSTTNPYTDWTKIEAVEMPCLRHGCENTKTYANKQAAANTGNMPYGAVVVTEHYADDGAHPVIITICYRYREGYHADSDDWYWAHFLPCGKVVQTVADRAEYGKPGFVTYEDDGRLWVFGIDSATLGEFLESGELAKHVIRPGSGPGGITLKSSDEETLTAYLAVVPGFVSHVDADGRLWVFRTDSTELAEFQANGEPEKHVTRPGAGPGGVTLKAANEETLTAYLAAVPGFVSHVDADGRLWVFRTGSTELAEFQAKGEPEKHVTRPGAGPGGVTLKAANEETLTAYLAAAPGFVSRVDADGRLWVFRSGSTELAEFQAKGEPEKHVTRPGAGPLGLTVKGPDNETLDAYLRSVN